jgi:hypothetical protein
VKVLLLHQNFPGQYLQIARHFGARFPHQSVFLTQRLNGSIPGIRTAVYKPRRAATDGIHHYVRDTEACVLNAQEVYRAALGLKASGFAPDLILGHNGWGEIWYLKEVFPKTPLIGYFEFFYHLTGADVGFDPTEGVSVDTGPRLRTKNIGNLLGLNAVDWGQCPTEWQKSRYPVNPVWCPCPDNVQPLRSRRARSIPQ